MNTTNFRNILDFAKKLAIKAGKLIVNEREKHHLTFKMKNGIEIVSSADLAADQLINQNILEKFPTHLVLSEELSSQCTHEQIANNPIWIVDPIDGTVNYSHNINEVGISIALAINGIVQIGVVHAPFLKETFYAIKGKGAWLNRKKINVSTNADYKQSLIATGFPYDKNNIELLIKRVKNVFINFQDIRRAGAASLDICNVACGRLDGYYENLKVWDMAAAVLIAKEAGAKFGHLNSVPQGQFKDLYPNDVIVANPNIFDKLLQVLKI